MKKLTIFTDPHIGTSRQAHTTRESSAELKLSLYHQAMAIVETATNPVICVGDLFDRACNPESVIVQGYNIASRCWMTLAGNHDLLNRLDTVTSLQAIAEMGAPVCAAPDLTNPYFDSFESIYMVPHHASQEVFEKAMKNAAAHAAENRDGLASYLFLHCNYDFALAVDDNTLNLPANVAKELITAFDYIFIGHEHNCDTHLGGQVVILGNTHPTSFHDIGDKFIYHLELDTAVLTKELIWSKEQAYREIKLGSELPDLTGVQFVDVTGTESVSEALEVSEFIRDIWKAAQYKSCSAPGEGGEPQDCCELFAVRNKVDIKDSLADVSTDIDAIEVVDLKTRISRDLEGTDLAELFHELVKEVAA